jgi:hypothetical protein
MQPTELTLALLLAQWEGGQFFFLLAAVLMLTIFVLLTRRKVRKSIGQPRVDVRDQVTERVKYAKLTRDLEEVMGELDELARQVNGRLDTRFAKLEAVIRDADERIDRLSRLVREAHGHAGIDLTISDEARAVPTCDGAMATAGKPPTADIEPPAELHADVYTLADEGRSPIEIAEETGRTTGEIELILALRRAKKQAEAVSPKYEPVSKATGG